MLTPLAAADADAILSLADGKAHLRVVDDSEDALITDLIAEAIDFVERYASVSLDLRAWLWVQDRFTSTIRLPIGPLGAVTGIDYYDTAGTDTALASSDWIYGRGSVAAAYGTTWPVADGRPGGVRITFTAGYTLPADIPPMLLSAVKVALTALFEDRSNPDFTGAMRCADRVRVPAL